MLCNTDEGSEEHHVYVVPIWLQSDEGGRAVFFRGDTWFFSAQTDQHLLGPHESLGEQLRLASYQRFCLRLPRPFLTDVICI